MSTTRSSKIVPILFVCLFFCCLIGLIFLNQLRGYVTPRPYYPTRSIIDKFEKEKQLQFLERMHRQRERFTRYAAMSSDNLEENDSSMLNEMYEDGYNIENNTEPFESNNFSFSIMNENTDIDLNLDLNDITPGNWDDSTTSPIGGISSNQPIISPPHNFPLNIETTDNNINSTPNNNSNRPTNNIETVHELPIHFNADEPRNEYNRHNRHDRHDRFGTNNDYNLENPNDNDNYYYPQPQPQPQPGFVGEDNTSYSPPYISDPVPYRDHVPTYTPLPTPTPIPISIPISNPSIPTYTPSPPDFSSPPPDVSSPEPSSSIPAREIITSIINSPSNQDSREGFIPRIHTAISFIGIASNVIRHQVSERVYSIGTRISEFIHGRIRSREDNDVIQSQLQAKEQGIIQARELAIAQAKEQAKEQELEMERNKKYVEEQELAQRLDEEQSRNIRRSIDRIRQRDYVRIINRQRERERELEREREREIEQERARRDHGGFLGIRRLLNIFALDSMVDRDGITTVNDDNVDVDVDVDVGVDVD